MFTPNASLPEFVFRQPRLQTSLQLESDTQIISGTNWPNGDNTDRLSRKTVPRKMFFIFRIPDAKFGSEKRGAGKGKGN